MVKVTKVNLKKKNLGILSPLEDCAIRILWKNGSGMKVRDIHSVLKKNGTALTSVAVLLARLYQKGLVSRNISVGRGGEFYIYHAKPREIIEKTITEKTVNGLIERFGKNAISYFHERFSKGD